MRYNTRNTKDKSKKTNLTRFRTVENMYKYAGSKLCVNAQRATNFQVDVALDDSDGVPREEAMFLDILENCFLTRFV